MLNFQNEVEQINDSYLRYFFGWDFFHDGSIHSIEILDDNNIEMTITSYRDWENDLDKCNLQSHTFDEKYKYICKFKSCKYYSSEIKDNGYIFLNARFKDSAKVREISKKSHCTYLHLRIQVTGGYIDLIFSKFEIKKFIDEIEIPKKIPKIHTYKDILERYKNRNINSIIDLLKNGNSIDKMLSIQYLGCTDSNLAIKTALKMLTEEDAQISAIWVIGNYGNLNDLPKLYELWTKTEGLLKRHVEDSIEKITYRFKNDVK